MIVISRSIQFLIKEDREGGAVLYKSLLPMLSSFDYVQKPILYVVNDKHRGIYKRMAKHLQEQIDKHIMHQLTKTFSHTTKSFAINLILNK